MADEREHTGGPDKGERAYSEGLDDREDIPEDERIGRFSEGEETLPDDEEDTAKAASARARSACPRATRRSTWNGASARARRRCRRSAGTERRQASLEQLVQQGP